MKKLTMAVAALVIAVPLSATVLAGGRGGCDYGHGYGHGEGRGPMHWDDARGPKGMLGPRMMDKLDLSAEQREQMRSLMQGWREQRRSGMWAESRQQMHDLMMAEQFDENAAKALLEKRDTLRQQHQLERLRQHHQMMSVLTPEQKAEFEQMMEDWQPGPGNGKGPGKGQGQGKGPGQGAN